LWRRGGDGDEELGPVQGDKSAVGRDGDVFTESKGSGGLCGDEKNQGLR